MALEYGTVPVLDTLQALRAEQWLNAHPDAPASLADAIRAQVMRAFYTDTDSWREQVVAQARESLLQAWTASAPDQAAPARDCAITSSPSKMRLSRSSKCTDMCGAIFQPAPPVM
jgi:hypothetical protein